MKFGQLIDNNKTNIFLENQAGSLQLASGLQHSFDIFR